jgi:DNA-binding transcriptional ArsR family regulator
MAEHLRPDAYEGDASTAQQEADKVAVARQQIHQAEAFRGLGQLAKVLCEPARLRIVEALMTAELSVSGLAEAIDRQPSATSQHLRVLRELGIVEHDRRGKENVYRLRHGVANDQMRAILSLLAHPDELEGEAHGGHVRGPRC